MSMALAKIHELLIPLVLGDGIMDIVLSSSILKLDGFFPHVSQSIKVMGCLLARCYLHVRFHEWRSRDMRLPHSSIDLVEWTCGCNGGIQTASWSAHEGIGGDGSGKQ